MTEDNLPMPIDLPASFLPQICEDAFAILVFTHPRSKKWPMVWNFCQGATCLEEGKNYLAIFNSDNNSIVQLCKVLHEAYSWKSAYLFIHGKLIDNKDHASQWMRCYLQSFEHEDPQRTYCLKENYYYHFQNQLSKTAKKDQTVSFMTPCLCTAAFARFSDRLPASFKEQFDHYAKIRFAYLCPNYNLDNFEGPFVMDGSPYDISIKFSVDLGSNDKPAKKKAGCLKVALSIVAGIAIGTVLIFLLGLLIS